MNSASFNFTLWTVDEVSENDQKQIYWKYILNHSSSSPVK